MKYNDKQWMKRCLAIAEKGIGFVSPNPLVGAVIVKHGKVIAQGFHEQYGGHHAEVNAINNALKKNRTLVGATMYINLEPCYHYGKTPPCVDAILQYCFSRVVIALEDPNPLVAGKSIDKLRTHGVSVTVGILKKDAAVLNKMFFKYIQTRYPYVALKAAQTSDGFIARDDGSSRWITNRGSRKIVHRLRSEYDAVLVGANTVFHDDPLLTVRNVSGRNPMRVIIDGHFSVPVTSKVFNSQAKTIVFISRRFGIRKKDKIAGLKKRGVEVVQMKEVKNKLDVKEILRNLHSRGIGSVLVEGGQQIYAEFINAKSVDLCYLFTAAKKFGSGIKTFEDISVSYTRKLISSSNIGTDRLQEFSIHYQ